MPRHPYFDLKRKPTTFQARYPGRCCGCGERVEVDDAVRYEDDELVHADCTLEPSGDEATTETCDRCFLAVAINGKCGCTE